MPPPWRATSRRMACPRRPPGWSGFPWSVASSAQKWTELTQLESTALRERLEPALQGRHPLAARQCGRAVEPGPAGRAHDGDHRVVLCNGEQVAAGVRAFFRRLGGEGAESLVALAASSARAVALGVVLTAVLQALLTGIALAVAGVPAAALLGGVALVLCLAQVGPLLILVAAVALALLDAPHHGGRRARGSCRIGLVSMDNILKPILITRGRRPAAPARLRGRGRRHAHLRPSSASSSGRWCSRWAGRCSRRGSARSRSRTLFRLTLQGSCTTCQVESGL